jgi:hypothetical protein
MTSVTETEIVATLEETAVPSKPPLNQYYTPTFMEEFDSLCTPLLLDLHEHLVERFQSKGFMNTSTPTDFINMIQNNVKATSKDDLVEEPNVESD